MFTDQEVAVAVGHVIVDHGLVVRQDRAVALVHGHRGRRRNEVDRVLWRGIHGQDRVVVLGRQRRMALIMING